MKKLALFDFDGTISKGDSQIKFMRVSVGNFKFYIGVLLNLHIGLLYILKIISSSYMKSYFIRLFFNNMSYDKFIQLGEYYSKNYLKKNIFSEAQKELDNYKKDGVEIVVVSASIENWLYYWCKESGYSLIATKLEVDTDGKLTGKLGSKNCYGIEKVNRIKEIYNLSEYDHIVAYGNSRGDKEMLELAHESYYKPFNK